ncbi:MAG: helix-turn-helix domain-containing protein [Calditrichia bacterium]
MEAEIQYFNSEEAAKMLGVNVSTIKRWTDEGKLECIRTQGGHRKFLMEHLAAFLEKNKKKTERVNLFPLENKTDLQISNRILKGDFAYLIGYSYDQALACNRDKLQQVLNGLYLAQYPLHQIYDRLITPVLYRVGDLWEQEKLSIVEEHIASQTIRDCVIRLQGIIRLPRRKSGKALCLNFSHEMHSMALKLVEHILELRGYKVFYSGQNTPFLQIERVFENYHPDRVYVSGTILANTAELQSEFDKMCELCSNYGTKLYVGGRVFDTIKFSHSSVVRRLFTFEDVHNF